MKEKLLEYIVCPKCKSPFNLKNTTIQGKEILEGTLECRNDHFYLVENGIPSLIERNLDKDQDQTSDSFRFKWHRVPDFGFTSETEKFMRQWYVERYNWGTQRNLERFLKTRTCILDAGCGLGRDLKFYARNSNGQVFGIDISQAIDLAYRHVGCYSNVHLLRADIMSLPFSLPIFDFIAAHGVLHHTPNTKKALKNLVKLLRLEGQIAIYVYKKKGPIREFCDDYIRSRTTLLTGEDCWKVSEIFTQIGKTLSDLNAEIEISEDVPYLDIRKGRYNVQRLIYYNILKCFWNQDWPYEVNVMTNFDWYHPKYAWRHTSEEVQKWFEKLRLQVVGFDVSPSGISARGEKEKCQS